MKKLINALKAVSGIAAAILIYITATEIADKGENILTLVISSVFALVTLVLCFAVSDLQSRVSNLEDTLGIYIDKGYEEERTEKKTCRSCGAEIDADYALCPYCGEKCADGGIDGNPYVERIAPEYFATEDPDYKGTDYSGEEVVSANFDLDGEE